MSRTTPGRADAGGEKKATLTSITSASPARWRRLGWRRAQRVGVGVKVERHQVDRCVIEAERCHGPLEHPPRRLERVESGELRQERLDRIAQQRGHTGNYGTRGSGQPRVRTSSLGADSAQCGGWLCLEAAGIEPAPGLRVTREHAESRPPARDRSRAPCPPCATRVCPACRRGSSQGVSPSETSVRPGPPGRARTRRAACAA